MKKVCCAAGDKFKGFTHEDVSVRWWTSYRYYGQMSAKNESEAQLLNLFHLQASSEISGPSFSIERVDSMKVLSPITDLHAFDRLMYYPS